MIRRLLLARRARRAEALPGTTCYSPCAGRLTVAGPDPLAGLYISIERADGSAYRLFHLDFTVHRPGRPWPVRAGDVIGNCPTVPEGPRHRHAR